MLLPLLIAIDDVAEMTARARTLTSAEQRCLPSADVTDITVCGLRHADRFRVPFIVHDAGDPRHEGVEAERVRLLHRTSPIDEMTPFLVGGGMAGVSVTINTGTGGTKVRKPAP